MAPIDLARFRAAYGAFLRPERILLTGHSPPAGPAVWVEAQRRVSRDAAEYVDDKWGAAIDPIAARVARGVSERLGYGPDAAIAFGRSTHELAFRLLTSWHFGPQTRI